MRIGRRAALIRLGVGSGALLAAGSGLIGCRKRAPAPPRSDAAPAPDLLAKLLGFAESVIGFPVERGHYAELFRWRAANVPGQRELYQAFAAGDREAGESVRHTVLALFARTDAWVRSGYQSWPGVPRGFAGLDRPPVRR